MKVLSVVIAAIGLALVGDALTPRAEAAAWNRKTKVKFSAPVEIPGVHLPGWGVLPAGTYVFKILDSQSNRHIVQIFSEDEKTVYATILAVPNFRLQATDKTVVTFSERPAGQPEALHAWFYPGRQWGEEFVYPKAKAIELAKLTNRPVLFTPTELPVELPEPVRSAQAPVVIELKRAPIMAVNPAGEEVQLAQVVTPPPAAELQDPEEAVPAAQVAPATLPATASPLPFIGLLGLLSLGAGLGVRAARRRLS